MMFIENKYKNWYFNIIESAKNRSLTGYVEKHHIIPKSLGGLDTIANIVKLTAREHFIVHMLLVKITTSTSKKKMYYALGMFVRANKKQDRIYTARQYDRIRNAISIARKGTTHSKETRAKISKNLKGNIPWNKGKKTGPCTEERKQKLSKFWKGKPKSAEHSANISLGKMGHTAGMTGKKHTIETKNKMSINMKGHRGPQKRTLCPNCHIETTYRHIKYCKDRI